MSENKRKAARTQGRFSNERECRPTRRDKEKLSDQKGSQSQSVSLSKDEKPKNPCRGAVAAEWVSIQYEEDSTHTFAELTEGTKEEIRERGERVLSETENGISKIIYEPDFMHQTKVEELMAMMEKTVPWSDKNIKIHGIEYAQPRQVAWYGPFPYKYSGALLDAAEMPQYILDIKADIENFLKRSNIDVNLNSVLLNLYRNGKDSVAWHSDDEKSMGISPTIASLSLGAVRTFEMRPKDHVKSNHSTTTYKIQLKPGSLLIMDGCMQKDWQHQVPKEKNILEPRINLTFRTVRAIEKIRTKVPSTEVVTSTSNYNITQPEHTYDPDSFPLLPPACNEQRKTTEDGIFDTKQELTVQTTLDIITTDANVLDKSGADDFENNLNKNIHSDKIDNCLLYDKTMSLNLSESVEAPDSTSLPVAGNECASCVESEERVLHKDNLEHELSLEKEVNHYGEVSSQPQDLKGSIDNEQHEKPQETNKYQLNANAPDFIPKSIVDKISSPRVTDIFIGRSLKELANYYFQNDIRSDEMRSFSAALMEGLKQQKERKDIFTPRDWFELDVLCKLSENGQNEENQRVINHRICSLTKNASKHDENKQSRYHQRPSYGGNRNLFYKSSPHRY